MTEEEKPKTLSLRERMALKKQGANKIEEFHMPAPVAQPVTQPQVGIQSTTVPNPNANPTQVGTSIGAQNPMSQGGQTGMPPAFIQNKLEKGPLVPNMMNPQDMMNLMNQMQGMDFNNPAP